MSLYVEIKDVSKKIRGQRVLSNINLALQKGKIYGIKGKNGSGKTMLLRLISGLIRPTTGELYIGGKKLDQNFPDRLGLLIEYPGFLPNYTGFQNLKLLASIQNIINDTEIIGILEQVGLDPEDKRKVKKYSLGMKQRLGIAQAVMENPDLIVLDEPTNALDKNAVNIVRDILINERNNNKTIIIASHDTEELNYLCDEIFTIENGTLTEHTTTSTAKVKKGIPK